jgi:hypothetical protein
MLESICGPAGRFAAHWRPSSRCAMSSARFVRSHGSQNALTRRVLPAGVPPETERRAPRRSLRARRHRCGTTRSRQLGFVQVARRFGGPSARTCTQPTGLRADECRGRPETTAQCRLFPEPNRGSPQWPVRRELINGPMRWCIGPSISRVDRGANRGLD